MTAPVLGVIDADTHVSETPDVWTSRLPRKWVDAGPQVDTHPSGEVRWRLGDRWLQPVGMLAVAGWPEWFPSHPPTLAEADPACYDPHARLQRMDEYGISAAVLYPNLIAFETFAFLDLDDRGLALACVQASNDWLAEFAAIAPTRLVPLAMLPFWDVELAVAEMERCRDLGHRGVIWGLRMTNFGLPHGTDTHWDRLYAAAQDLQMSINLHAAFVQVDAADAARMEEFRARAESDPMQRAMGVMTFMNNIDDIARLITSGLCHRFPDLQFVSVESGFGFLPYVLEAMDWGWGNTGGLVDRAMKGWLKPSEYFRRQIHATFWFERAPLVQLPQLADNVMYSTDFPHPTSMSPGPASTAEVPRTMIEHQFEGIDPETRRKVLHDNAARLYRFG